MPSDEESLFGFGLIRRSRGKGLLGMGLLNTTREDLKSQAKSQAAQFVAANVMNEAQSRGVFSGGVRDGIMKALKSRPRFLR